MTNPEKTEDSEKEPKSKVCDTCYGYGEKIEQAEFAYCLQTGGYVEIKPAKSVPCTSCGGSGN